MDKIRAKYGWDAVKRASLLEDEGEKRGSSDHEPTDE
jgi:hypothetical protein